MSLIWILLFCLLNFSLSLYFDYIENDKKITLKDNYGYIDISEFGGYFQLHIVATVKGGAFGDEKHLKMNGYNEKPHDKPYDFPTSIYYKKENHEMKGSQYTFQTLEYYISRNSDWEYCYFQFPGHISGNLEVTITTSGIPVLVVYVGIPAVFILIIIGIVILVIKLKGKKSKSTISNPQPVYRPPPQPTIVTTTFTSAQPQYQPQPILPTYY